MQRHRVLVTVVVLAMLATGLESTVAAANLRPAKVEVITDVVIGFAGANLANWAPDVIAYDSSYCAPYNISVTPEVLGSSELAAAIDNDTVNFVVNNASVLLPMAQGQVKNERVIASLGYEPSESVGIFATPQITRASELDGKTFGATSPDSPSHLSALAMLKHKRVPTSGVSFDYLSDDSSVLSALASGTVQAAWGNAPLPGANMAAGDHLLLPLSSYPALGAATSLWLIGNSSFMNAYPSAVKSVLKCLSVVMRSGRSTNEVVLSRLQNIVGVQVGGSTLSAEAWPEYPEASGLLPVDQEEQSVLQSSVDLQLGAHISAKMIRSIVATKWMDGVTSVPVANPTGKSAEFAPYSGR